MKTFDIEDMFNMFGCGICVGAGISAGLASPLTFAIAFTLAALNVGAILIRRKA